MSPITKTLQSINEKNKQRIADETTKQKKSVEPVKAEDETIKAKSDKNINVKVVSKIDLASLNTKTKPDKKKKEEVEPKKGKKAEVVEEEVKEVVTPETV